MASRVRNLRRPTISVACPTDHPGAVVAAVLTDLRQVVDEVIVAADARVSDEDLAQYAQVADALLRFEFAGSNRHWPWLAAQARGDWLLIHDGDELLSSALIDALGDLVSDRRIHQYSLPIHWTWPDNAHRLTGEPWDSGHRLRLVRNDGRLAFHAAKHALAVADSPTKYTDELPVYHLDLLLSDRATREAKVARYDGELFGLMTAEGLPVNEAYYVPESGGHQRTTARIPAEDADRINRVLHAQPKTAVVLRPASVAVCDRAQIEWYAPRAELPRTDYRATVELARPLPVFVAEYGDHPVWVRVTNDGNARWPGVAGRQPEVRVGVYWRGLDRSSREEAGRGLLPHSLDPHESTLVPVNASGPSQAGPSDLVIDLVHEGVQWFECGLSLRVDVQPSARERLDALTARYGPLVPVDAVVHERRAVARPNGLLHHTPSVDRIADAELDELTRDLELGIWTIDIETIGRLAELVRERVPGAVVEFGSGTSTIVLAWLLGTVHTDGWPRLVSFEQDLLWLERTKAGLAKQRLAGMAEVIHAPVGSRGNSTPACYLLDDAAEKILSLRSPELIFVDGPSFYSGASRLGTIDLIAPFLRGDAIVLLDDALRDAELCIAQAWQRRPDLTVHGIRATPKGLLEATLSAPEEGHIHRSSSGRSMLKRVRSAFARRDRRATL